jgi:hypothetical protein
MQSNNLELGSTALTTIRALPSLVSGATLFTFVVYQPTTSLSDRLLQAESPLDSSVLSKVERIREVTESVVPYWEAVLAAAWGATNFGLFAKEALRHDLKANAERVFTVTRTELLDGRVDREVASLQPGQVIALDSRCTLDDGSQAHLPLMDFRVLPRSDQVSDLLLALRLIDQRRGAILHSGRSYHYYGFEPMSGPDWLLFLGRCLLLSPLTDSRYIAHRLIGGSASLRVHASTAKPQIPYVVAVL